MCQISKTLSQLSGDRPRIIESGTNTLTIQRQESVVMENLRQIEEREALEKWERIVRYCKEVISNTLSLQSFQFIYIYIVYLFIRCVILYCLFYRQMNLSSTTRFHQLQNLCTIIQLKRKTTTSFNGEGLIKLTLILPSTRNCLGLFLGNLCPLISRKVY